MAESWQTIEQAAVSLRLSVRTVNRHIAAGKLQSRLTDGRREVLVDTSADAGSGGGAPTFSSPFADGPPASASTGDFANGASVASSNTPAFGHPQQQPQSTALTLDQETVLALADNAAEKAEMAVSAYQALARVADAQAQQVRRTARAAWAAVAVMAVGVTGAVGWATHRVTRLSVERDGLVEQVAERARAADNLSAERETLRAELVTKEQSLRAEAAAAREQAARVEGTLAALKAQEQARQTREAVMAAAPTNPASAVFSQLGLGRFNAPDSSDPSRHPTVEPSDDGGQASATQAQPDDAAPPKSDEPAGTSDALTASADAGPSQADAIGGHPALATPQPNVELDQPDAPADTRISDTSRSDTLPPADDAVTAKPDAPKHRRTPPTSRPVTPRRKARGVAPRPAAPPDSPSAGMTDEH